jgi:GNAT superfamily N-acetyltransferase
VEEDPKLLIDRIADHFSETFRMIWRDEPNGAHQEGKGWHRLLTRLPHPYGNVAVLDPGADGRAAQEAMEPFAGADYPVCAICLDPEPTTEADRLLKSTGYTVIEPMPLMAVQLAKLLETRLPEGVEFLEIGDPELWAGPFAAGFGVPIEIGRLCAASVNNPEFRLFAARRDTQILGTSMLVLLDGLAGIYCVATLPEERGKGIGAHMTAEPLRLAAAQGYETGILQASDAGYPVYRRLGFEDLGSLPIYLQE